MPAPHSGWLALLCETMLPRRLAGAAKCAIAIAAVVGALACTWPARETATNVVGVAACAEVEWAPVAAPFSCETAYRDSCARVQRDRHCSLHPWPVPLQTAGYCKTTRTCRSTFVQRCATRVEYLAKVLDLSEGADGYSLQQLIGGS